MKTQKLTVALLDDEANFRSAIARLLKTTGCSVELFESGEDFINSLDLSHPDCLLLDLHMQHMTGFGVLEAMAERHTNVPVIVITGHEEPGNAERAKALGAADYLLKPVQRTSLFAAIEHVCPSFNH
jgi:FixJ family two-component response regulator